MILSIMEPEIAVIGAGPAGVACTIQLARFGYYPTLFERGEIGGLVRNANCINNYPGFPNGITGLKFSKLLQKHIMNYDIKIIKKEVLRIEFENNHFHVHLKNEVSDFNFLIVSSGTKPIKPDGFSKQQLELFSYDIVKDILRKNKKFIIVGAGDAAFDYALTLSSANDVIILNRRKKINAIPELQDKVLNNENIKYYDDTTLIGVTKEKTSLIVRTQQNGKEPITFICNHIIFAIGREPNLDFLDKSILLVKDELLLNKRLFIIGDAGSGKFRQISISTGSAIKTAMELHFYLLNSNLEY
ncbi:MAG: NAD(P)/FAD-dependent oxidoreductase [Bacteroidetes bacterium]|nr:NAD(P)/FAD-dependent oxidoreductase [Bacteroidota bacterium]